MKTPVQDALIQLRTKLHYTQQEFALILHVSIVSVCRWETSRPPSGGSLAMLAHYARTEGEDVAARIFEEALRGARDPRSMKLLTLNNFNLDYLWERLDRIEGKLDQLLEKQK